ncbi:MAG TPA: hypothetical protein VMF89_23390, partial [Polyangiales bacterium]|nr:hypothetical protein [Polyangiales bacterium]
MISKADFSELSLTCQQFLWSLVTDPPAGRVGLKQSSLVARSNWLKMIVRWMAREGIPQFRAMTPASFRLFREWLAGRANRRTGKPIKATTLSKYLYLISDL